MELAIPISKKAVLFTISFLMSKGKILLWEKSWNSNFEVHLKRLVYFGISDHFYKIALS